MPLTLVTALKSSLLTLRTGKISSWYSLTSNGSLHRRPHSSFILVLLYSLRREMNYIRTDFSRQENLQGKYSLKLLFQPLLIIPVLHVAVAVWVLPDGQYFKHQNAKGPNITPENGNKRHLRWMYTHALSNLCRKKIVFFFFNFKTLSQRIDYSIQFPAFVCLFKNSHGGEFLFEKRLRRRPLHGQLLPLLLTLLGRGDRQTKVSNLRSTKLVEQHVPGGKILKVSFRHLAARSLWTMLRLSSRSIPRATSICQARSLLHIFGTCFILCGSVFHF